MAIKFINVIQVSGYNYNVWCDLCKKDAQGEVNKCLASLDEWSKHYSKNPHRHLQENITK